MRYLLRSAAALALASVTVAACGIGTDDEPHVISESQVPESVPAGGSTLTTGGSDQPGEQVFVWFLQDRGGTVRLTQRTRTVARPPTDNSILEALLLDPPSESERAYNITTAIPSSTTLASAPERDGEVLVVDLSDGIYQVVGDSLRHAYGQIVCTATDIEGVEAVRFEVEGEPHPAFDGNGESTNRALRCEDYASLLAARASVTGADESE